jgi:integrase/recombinase XerD
MVASAQPVEALAVVGSIGGIDAGVIVVDGVISPRDADSVSAWAATYFGAAVAGAPNKTVLAKQRDLEQFLRFYQVALGHDRIDGWTPSLSRHFQRDLRKTVSAKTGQPLQPTTINRVMATVRHFGRWVHKRRPLAAGNPFAGVKDIATDEPEWRGLSEVQVNRLKGACDHRLRTCGRKNQNPQLEAAVFYVLLNTGLRAHELSRLDLSQYHHRAFHDVKRKGSRVSARVSVPSEARAPLDAYLAEKRGQAPGPLMLSRYGARLTPLDIARICERLSNQACAQVTNRDEHFKLTPHMLRHTLLKRVADKNGVHFAQRVSGNVSMREIFRYTKPSDAELDETTEELWT